MMQVRNTAVSSFPKFCGGRGLKNGSEEDDNNKIIKEANGEDGEDGSLLGLPKASSDEEKERVGIES